MLNRTALAICLRMLVAALAIAPTAAYAQSTEIPPDAVRGLADDLAQIQALINESRRVQLAGQWADAYGKIGEVTVTKTFAKAKAGAAKNTATVAELRKGTKYRVIDRTEGWYAVELPASDGKLRAGWVHATDVVPQLTPWNMPYHGPASAQQRPSETSAITDAIYRALMEKVAELRKKYENNPHFKAKGFEVSLGLSPSVSISFEFK